MNPDKLEMYIERAMSEITHCGYCQPYDEGDVVWIFGDRIYLPELLAELNIPEDYHEEVANSLSCPYCGADIELNDDVGIKTFYEREIEAKWEEWHKKYDPEFIEFFYHIEKFPYLGLSHKLGRQLNKKIPSLPSLTINDEKWFRARKVNNGKILASDDFYPADPKDIVVGEGRFNHFGQSVFSL